MRTETSPALASLITILVLWSGASAGTSPTPAEPTAETRAELGDNDLLRGPSSAPAARARTLVERDAAGKVKRLDVTPEEAAIDLLKPLLDTASRQRADTILAERAAMWDAFTRENYREIVELANGGKGPEKVKAVMAMLARAPELRDIDGLRTRLAEAMPAEQAAAFRGLLDEYRKAVGEDIRAEASASGVGPQKLVAEEAFKAFGREIKRSFDREATMGKDRLEAGLRALSLSPDDELKVRNILIEHAQKAKFDGGGEGAGSKVRLYMELRKVLSAEQMRTLKRVAGDGK